METLSATGICRVTPKKIPGFQFVATGVGGGGTPLLKFMCEKFTPAINPNFRNGVSGSWPNAECTPHTTKSAITEYFLIGFFVKLNTILLFEKLIVWFPSFSRLVTLTIKRQSLLSFVNNRCLIFEIQKSIIVVTLSYEDQTFCICIIFFSV